MHEFSVIREKGVEWSEEFEDGVGNDQMDDYVIELDDAGAPARLIDKIADNDLQILSPKECQILHNILLKVAMALQDTEEDELLTDRRYAFIKLLRLGSENKGLEAH